MIIFFKFIILVSKTVVLGCKGWIWESKKGGYPSF